MAFSALASFAQTTVAIENNSPDYLYIQVHFQDTPGDCNPESYTAIMLPPMGGVDVPIPPGSYVLAVRAMKWTMTGGIDYSMSGHVVNYCYFPCSPVAIATPYNLTWTIPCEKVTIN